MLHFQRVFFENILKHYIRSIGFRNGSDKKKKFNLAFVSLVKSLILAWVSLKPRLAQDRLSPGQRRIKTAELSQKMVKY